jgi:hypothetical protein
MDAVTTFGALVNDAQGVGIRGENQSKKCPFTS